MSKVFNEKFLKLFGKAFILLLLALGTIFVLFFAFETRVYYFSLIFAVLFSVSAYVGSCLYSDFRAFKENDWYSAVAVKEPEPNKS